MRSQHYNECNVVWQGWSRGFAFLAFAAASEISAIGFLSDMVENNFLVYIYIYRLKKVNNSYAYI